MALFLFVGLPKFSSVLSMLEVVALTFPSPEDQRKFIFPLLFLILQGSPFTYLWAVLTMIDCEINEPIIDVHV